MLTKFICTDYEECFVDDCLNKCRLNKRCAPLPYLHKAAEQREWKGKPSVTQLIKGTRLAYMEITKPYSVKPTRMYFVITKQRALTK